MYRGRDVGKQLCETLSSHKTSEKSGGKNVTKKTQKNYNAILGAMQPDVWYKATDFKAYVQVKESCVKELLADL